MEQIFVGPWGGIGGTNWDDGFFTGVREITLVYGGCIDSILVVYDNHGQTFRAQKHGGDGGYETAEIKLEYPNEFLIGVSGLYGPYQGRWAGSSFIRSLTFKSNRRTFGPYGVEEGKRFTFSSYPTREIVGFCGRSGAYLDSIGLRFSHAHGRTLLPQPVTSQSFLVGPYGGMGGTNWDDGIYTGVRSITLVFGLCIESILVVYDKHGQPFPARRHGRGGGTTKTIELRYPNEFLINVTGYYGAINANGDQHIRSLMFQSNHRTFGPYGVQEGMPFTLSRRGRRILGLKGRSRQYLHAIAFYVSAEVGR